MGALVLVYIIGCVVSAVIFGMLVFSDKNEDITLASLVARVFVIILVSLPSWFTVVVSLIVMHGDMVIIKRKKD